MKGKLRNPAGESVRMGPHKKQKQQQQQQRGGIPMELLEVEILKRLPVRSLLRFRSVSKSWKTLIDSNYFINLHLQHDDINHDDRLVALSTSSIHRTYGIEVVDKSSFTKLFRFTTGLVDEVKKDVALNFIGTCNGLICIHAEYYLETYHRIQHVYLWNPVMGVTKVIDHKVQHWDDENKEFSTNYGFAYDSENHDYKVVMIEHCSVFNLSTCIAKKVYSLKNSSWKTIDDQSTFPSNFFVLPQNYQDYNRTPFVHGAIHWLALDWTINSEWTTLGERDHVAISFRIGEEVFEEIVLPQPARRRHNNLLVSYKSLLACMVSDSDNVHAASVHLWVMKEYGVSESWTKLYTIDSSGLAPTPLGDGVVCIGFGEDENEHVFTVERTNKVLFRKNNKTSGIRQLTTSTSLPAILYDNVDAITFRPSLVKFSTNV